MGVVSLAEDERLRRRVALKTLSQARSLAPGAREKLVREAQLAARLVHPNVAAVHEAPRLDRAQVRRRFEERFSAARMARDYLSVYRSLARRKDRAA